MNQASANAADSLGYSLYGYLNQGFFSKDSLLCTTQAHSSSFGMPGTLVPYSLRSDNTISVILLVCFCLIIILGTHSYGLFTRQLKILFRAPRENSDTVRETSGEVNVMMTFVTICSLLLGISANLYFMELFNPHFLIDTNAIIVFILSALFLFYFLVKWFFQIQINLVFFGGKKNIQFMKSQVFMTACCSILLYPIVMLLVYFDLSIKSAVFYFCIIGISYEILTFYKSWIIFFRQKGLFLQNILYFCALEIIPILTFVSAMVMIVNRLKINY